mgnify:CR=1 FL=1
MRFVSQDLIERLALARQVQGAVGGQQDFGGFGERIVVLRGHAGAVSAAAADDDGIANLSFGEQPGQQALGIIRFRGEDIAAFAAVAGYQVEVLAAGADTLWFKLTEPVDQGVELIEVKFRPQIFANSASFRASIQDSGNPGFWQRVDEGDATDLVDSQVVTVLALEGNEVIKDLRLDSAVMTPNGDGIHDAVSADIPRRIV